MKNQFVIDEAAVIFSFPNGITVHIRQGDDNSSSVVAWEKRRGMGYNPEYGVFERGRYEILLSASELVDFLQTLKNMDHPSSEPALSRVPGKHEFRLTFHRP